MKALLAVAAIAFANEEDQRQRFHSFSFHHHRPQVLEPPFNVAFAEPVFETLPANDDFIEPGDQLNTPAPLQSSRNAEQAPLRAYRPIDNRQVSDYVTEVPPSRPIPIAERPIGREVIIDPEMRYKNPREPAFNYGPVQYHEAIWPAHKHEHAIHKPLFRDAYGPGHLVREPVRRPARQQEMPNDIVREPIFDLEAPAEPVAQWERPPITEVNASAGEGEIDASVRADISGEYVPYEAPLARAYTVYEKPYTHLNKKGYKTADSFCPRPGYALTWNNECCREAATESRLECPFGYSFDGEQCSKFYEPTVYCTKGTLFKGTCKVVRSLEPRYECPEGSTAEGEESCAVLEQYTPVEVCPTSTIRGKSGCLAVEYTEPALVCPPDTIPDGRKCRREIVTLRMKKGRVLSEENVEPDVDANEEDDAELTLEELEAMTHEAFAFDDLYADIAVGPTLECENGDCYGEWIPATSEFKIKTKKIKQPIVSEQLKWEKVKIPVTTAKVKDVKVKVPEVKVKATKEKTYKSPHEVVKVVTQAAEKVCPIGQRHGSTCVAETIVPPVLECPHPQLGPDCNRKVPVAPLASCTRGELVCDGYGCRCDIVREFAPEVTCTGGHVLINDRCVITTEWQRMCPLGYFLAGDGTTCMKTDCEPPLTIVSKRKVSKKLMESEEDADYEELV